MSTLQHLHDHLQGVKGTSDNFTARCPGHDDHQNSLQVKRRDDGKISVQCFAGCDIGDVLQPVGLKARDLYPDKPEATKPKPQIVCTYDYTDADGRLVFQVLRYRPKQFKQRRPDTTKPGGWAWSLDGIDRPLYRLPEVLRAKADGRPVFLVEGEKDADALAELGLTATTNAGGAGRWTDADADVLQGCDVIVIPDNDAPGMKAAWRRFDSIWGATLVVLPGLSDKGDVSDWLAAGGTVGELWALVGAARNNPPERPVEATEEVEVTATVSSQVMSACPRGLAEKYLQDCHPRKTLQWYRGEWWIYDDSRGWRVIDPPALRATLAEAMKDWWYLYETRNGDTEVRRVYNLLKESLLRDVEGQLRQPDKSMVENDREAPCWLHERQSAKGVVAFENGIVNVQARTISPHNPNLFTPNRVDYAFNPSAPRPVRWLRFLDELWIDNPDSILLLQEIMGWVVAGDGRWQKAVMVVGPKRSGKSTIASITKALIGEPSCCAPTMSGLATHFGLQGLIGKRLAVLGDARLSGRTDSVAVVENLLKIIGGDIVGVPRKYLDDWIGVLDVKFILLSNEMPRLPDASGAMASRFLVLQTKKSFFGCEDHNLMSDLMLELPGILNWALDGLERLKRQGRFTDLQSSLDAVAELEDLGSPVGAFVRDCCQVGRGYSVKMKALYDQYREWCSSEGVDRPLSASTFGRDLRSIAPEIEHSQFRTADGRRERHYRGIRII